jgi:hypothetical protein
MATNPVQIRTWGTTLISKVRFIFISLLRLKRGSNGRSRPRRLNERSRAMLPAQPFRRGLAKAVIGVNPAGKKKFRCFMEESAAGGA